MLGFTKIFLKFEIANDISFYSVLYVFTNVIRAMSRAEITIRVGNLTADVKILLKARIKL